MVTNFRAGADFISAKWMSTPQLTGERQGLCFLLQGEVTVADAPGKKTNQMCLLEQINLAFHMTLTPVILYVEKVLVVLHILGIPLLRFAGHLVAKATKGTPHLQIHMYI